MATERKRAAFDEMMNESLEKISAADLLDLMQERAEVAQAINMLPEKKKVELEVEPVVPKLKLGDLVEKLRGEKKKVEYELGPGFAFEPRVAQRFKHIPEWKKAAYEVDEPVYKLVINPADMESLLAGFEERLLVRLEEKGLLRK